MRPDTMIIYHGVDSFKGAGSGLLAVGGLVSGFIDLLKDMAFPQTMDQP